MILKTPLWAVSDRASIHQPEASEKGAFIPQPTLKKIPVTQLQGGCARFVCVLHQNKARHSCNLAIVVDNLAVGRGVTP